MAISLISSLQGSLIDHLPHLRDLPIYRLACVRVSGVEMGGDHRNSILCLRNVSCLRSVYGAGALTFDSRISYFASLAYGAIVFRRHKKTASDWDLVSKEANRDDD
jgi:hypothetical protein